MALGVPAGPQGPCERVDSGLKRVKQESGPVRPPFRMLSLASSKEVD